MISDLINMFRRRRARSRMIRSGMSAEASIPEADRGIPMNSSSVLAWFILVLLWSISSILMTLAQSIPQSSELPDIGKKAPDTISAKFDFRCESPKATEKEREKIRQKAPKYFQISAAANAALKVRIDRFLNAVRDYPAQTGTPEDTLAARLPAAERALFRKCVDNSSGRRYVDEELNRLLENGIFGSDALARLKKDDLVQIADRQKRFKLPRPVAAVADQKTAALQLARALMRFQPVTEETPEHIRIAADVFGQLISTEGTLTFDAALTRQNAEESAARISPIVKEYRRNQAIVHKGDLIDETLHEILTRYFAEKNTKENRQNDFSRILNNMLWSLALILMGVFYLNHLHRDELKGNGDRALLASIILLSLLAEYAGIRLFYFISGATQDILPSLVNDAVPIALAAISLTPILGFRVALCAGFYTAAVATLMLDMEFAYAMKGFVICFLSAFVIRNTTTYPAYLGRTLGIITLLILILNGDLIDRLNELESIPELVKQSVEVAIVNGLATSTLALLVLFAYEALFHISTNMSLMQLCDYNHPLLERMKREAPGTFFHSLTVATLAEDGARAIGANYLRAKAGAIFHDIGKLARPQYFTENNQNSANQHTALTPQMSSVIIRDHVKEGLLLARQYKLGSVVRDAIAQHHGNDLVHYFYREALENSRRTGEAVDEESFRYPGPKPQSKEIAIISLADASEAASRSLDKPTPERLEALVDKIFEQRIKDGQLNEANITLAELEKVRSSFIDTLLGMKHGRIAYPEEEEEHGNPLPVDSVRRPSGEKS